MSTTNRKLKFITFLVDGNSFECQLKTWRVVNNTEDGEKFYAFCAGDTPGTFDEEAGEFREEAEDDYALEMEFFADWRSGGINDFMWEHDQETLPFQLDHHPNIAAEHVRWTGNVKIKAPSAGGEVRTTEMGELTLPIIGKPTYTRVGA